MKFFALIMVHSGQSVMRGDAIATCSVCEACSIRFAEVMLLDELDICLSETDPTSAQALMQLKDLKTPIDAFCTMQGRSLRT